MPAVTIIQSEPMKIVAVPGYDPATSAVEWPREYFQDPATGFWTTVRRFEGTEAALLKIVNTKQAVGIGRVSHKEGDFYTLTLEIQGSAAGDRPPVPNTLTVTQWALEPSRLQKSLWLLPKVYAAMKKVLPDEQDRSRFRADFEALMNGQVTFNKVPAGDASKVIPSVPNFALKIENLFAYYGITDANAQAILKDMMGSRGFGTDSFVVPLITLVKTQTASPDATNAPPDFTNAGRIYTTNALLRTQRTIPNIIRAAILGDASMRAGVWFKEMPSLNPQDQTRMVVKTMWTFSDTYDAFVFGDPIT